MKFILTDSSVDRDSERVLVEGIKLENFIKNPVMLYGHRRDDIYWGSYEAPLPIGYWDEIKVENGQLTAVPVFNDTELAVSVKALVEQGTLRAASIGFKAISYSDDPAFMLPGQKYSTITQCELYEASIVDIPANPNAVVQKSFNKNGKKYLITGDNTLTKEQEQELSNIISKSTPKNNTMADLKKELKELSEAMTKGFTELATKIGLVKPEEKSAEITAISKSFDELKSNFEALEVKSGELSKQNETLTSEKTSLAETHTKALNDLKEAHASEKKTLEDENAELKAANLKLSGDGGGTTTPAIEKKDKNDSPAGGEPELSKNQKTELQAKTIAEIIANEKNPK